MVCMYLWMQLLTYTGLGFKSRVLCKLNRFATLRDIESAELRRIVSEENCPHLPKKGGKKRKKVNLSPSGSCPARLQYHLPWLPVSAVGTYRYILVVLQSMWMTECVSFWGKRVRTFPTFQGLMTGLSQNLKLVSICVVLWSSMTCLLWSFTLSAGHCPLRKGQTWVPVFLPMMMLAKFWSKLQPSVRAMWISRSLRQGMQWPCRTSSFSTPERPITTLEVVNQCWWRYPKFVVENQIGLTAFVDSLLSLPLKHWWVGVMSCTVGQEIFLRGWSAW